MVKSALLMLLAFNFTEAKVLEGFISSPRGALKVQYNFVDGAALIEGDIEISLKKVLMKFQY